MKNGTIFENSLTEKNIEQHNQNADSDKEK